MKQTDRKIVKAPKMKRCKQKKKKIKKKVLNKNQLDFTQESNLQKHLEIIKKRKKEKTAISKWISK